MELLSPLFQALAEASEDGIVLADGRGAIRYANRAMERIFGIARATLDGGSLGLLGAVWQHGQQNGGEPALVEYRRADGSRFLARTVASTMRDGGGRIVGRGAAIRPESASPPAPAAVVTATELEAHRRDNMLAALRQADFRITGKHGAASLLGLAPSTLRSQMRALGIQR